MKRGNKNKDEKDQVNEPGAEYSTPLKLGDIYNTVTISSLEEMENDNYKHWLSLTPEQRLAEHYNLIIQIYKDELARTKGLLYDKIYFHE